MSDEKNTQTSEAQIKQPDDIAMLKAAGVEIMSVRTRWWNYYMEDRTFSVPELKLLIDAVQSSKFITEMLFEGEE